MNNSADANLEDVKFLALVQNLKGVNLKHQTIVDFLTP